MRAAVASTGKKNKCWAKANSVFPNVTTHTMISVFPPGCSSFSENYGIADVGGTSGHDQGADCPGSGFGYLQGWRVHSILGRSGLTNPKILLFRCE